MDEGNGFLLSRRGFAITSLAAGFAAAAGPVNAQVIHTDADGLIAGEVKVPVSDGVIPAYRARPATGTHFPTVLVVQEIFGVHEHIKDICRRFAKLGYYAIAPSLYARYGDPSKYTDIKALVDRRRAQGAGQGGAERSRFHGRVCERRRRRHRSHGADGLLLGRAYRLALCGP